MPIANCVIKKDVKLNENQQIINKLSDNLNIDPADITMNFIKSDIQLGGQYELMIFLYLPSLWNKKDIEKIEMEFTRALSESCNISTENIFLITSIVESGNVVSNGNIEKW